MRKTGKLSFIITAVLLCFTIIFAGCSSGETSADASSHSEATDSKTSSSESTSEESYTVEHAMGSTTVKGTPERVVILTNHGTEALLALGVKPVGAVKSWTGDPWYDHIADQMEGAEVVGTESEVNLEKIATLKPDLIIGNKMRQEKIYDQLNAIAPTIFEETLRGDWKINFQLIAKALNREEKGEQVLGDYADRIASLQEKLGDKLSMDVSVIRFMAGDVRIYQKDSFSGIILEDIGFSRPESQDVDEFAIRGATKEMIPEMDGDILFYFTYEKGDGEALQIEKEWINDPLFQKLEAVKSGNAHKVSDAIWNTAGGVIAANKMLDDIETIFLK